MVSNERLCVVNAHCVTQPDSYELVVRILSSENRQHVPSKALCVTQTSAGWTYKVQHVQAHVHANALSTCWRWLLLAFSQKHSSKRTCCLCQHCFIENRACALASGPTWLTGHGEVHPTGRLSGLPAQAKMSMERPLKCIVFCGCDDPHINPLLLLERLQLLFLSFSR
jgi:hypothetical protein